MQEKCFQTVDSWKENASETDNPNKERKTRRKLEQDSTIKPAHRQGTVHKPLWIFKQFAEFV